MNIFMEYGTLNNKKKAVQLLSKTILHEYEGGQRSLNEILDNIYPIGSIYLSTNSTNPSNYFGGVWEQIKDRFLLACGDTYSNGSTGGEATHKLTINEMPSHNHGAVSTSGDENSPIALYPFSMIQQDYNIIDVNVIRPAGGNKAHNNMPPYFTVYCWYRTA